MKYLIVSVLKSKDTKMDKEHPLSSETKQLGHGAIAQNKSMQKKCEKSQLSQRWQRKNMRHPIWDINIMEPTRSVHGLKTCGQASPKRCPPALALLMSSCLFSVMHSWSCMPSSATVKGHVSWKRQAMVGMSLSHYFPASILEFLNIICIQLPSL